MRFGTPGRIMLAAVVLLATAGCASLSGDGPAASAPAAPAVDPALVPAPPADAGPDVTAAWEALRRGRVDAGPVAGDTAAARALAGWHALLRGDAAVAGSQFQAALERSPDLAVAAYGMGMVAENNGEASVAQRWYQRAQEMDPGLTRASLQSRRLALGDVSGLLLEAERARAQDDLAVAADVYREITERAPELPGPYLILSDIHAEQADAERAIAVLEQGLRRAGEQPALLQRLGGLYRSAERYREAAETYARLADVHPDDPAVAELAREARREYELAALPPEYRRLDGQEVISRAELAAILAIELDFLGRMTPDRTGLIIADAGESWAAPYIRRTVEWGLLDVYQNGAFLPEMQVRRSMLVEAAYRVLEILGIADRAPRPAIQDPPPAHVLYRPVQAVVGYDLLPTVEEGGVELLGTVSGAEALEVAERLTRLAREHAGRR